MSSNTGHRISRSNQGILYYDTVQTSWRPQLPLPKEIPAQFVQNSSEMDTKSTKKDTPPNKKWSFGRFFRKKKELDSDSSSDDDRKAGFVAQTQKPRKKEKRKRGSKVLSPGFDHIVINQKNGETNELFLPFETIETTESIRSSGSADRRGRREKRHRTSKQQIQRSSSSDDDVRSHNSQNSSCLLRYRSDESLGSGGVVGSRRSRAARTERYYKRMSRDENTPVGVATQQVGRWKTQPVQLSDYDHSRSSSHGYYLKNSNSMNNVPNVQQYIYAVPNKANKTNPVSSEKRSISYENHIHLQNLYDKRDGSVKSMPPPPPPRDPLRRVHVLGQNDLRPISYAFDKSAAPAPLYHMNNRCVSDDKLWGPEGSIYQTNFHRPASVQPAQQPRRFISRADREANPNPAVVNGVPGIDYKYIADAVPRSRKPIHILKSEGAKVEQSPNSAFTTPPPVIRTTKSGLPSPMKAASQFWRQIDQQEKQRRERAVDGSKPDVVEKSRSSSTSRAMTNAGARHSSYENFRALNGKVNKSVDEIDNVVSGSLYLKPTKDNENNFMEVSTKPYESKSRSMPNYYQRLSLQQEQQREKPPSTQTPLLNKYEEYIARKAPQNVIKPEKVPPPPPQRKSMKISTEDLRKPTTNLEDAINELEAIYKSLKLGDEDLLDRAERRDIPTPTNFEKYAVVSDEDEGIAVTEPDIVLDDVAYRNIKRANTMIKTIEPQPPFGIPVGPVPPSPNTDYLHVTPDKDLKKNRRIPQNIPDLVTDDLAVRALRKDVPGMAKPAVAFPLGSTKKKRAARSMSANIYNLIQRDAAKPSGGNLYDYADVDRALEKAGSLTDVRKEVDDIPSTFQLLKNLRKQENEAIRKTSPVFRHPSQGGAVFNLPSTLNTSPAESPHILQKPPIPLPRKSHSPEPMHNTKGMEEILNRIAREAKESSEKLSKELKELRTEKLLMVEKPLTPEMSMLDKDIEEASKAAKVCEEILSSVIPQPEQKEVPAVKPRRLTKDDDLIKKIEETCEAARYCEKLLKDVVTVEPPVTVETAEVVSQAISEIQDFVNGKAGEEINAADVGKPKEAVESSPVEVDLIDFSDDTEPEKQLPLTVSLLLQNVDPFKSEQIGKITERCMRQISDLQAEAAAEDSKRKNEDEGDYDNLNSEPETSNTQTCKQAADDIRDYDNIHGDHIAVVSERNLSSEAMAPLARQDDDEEDIDKIMKECEEQVLNKTPYTSLSSSDCPKSSSPTSSRHKSSSITSIHAFSSSDFVKSSSSEFHTPSTDPIKTFSTTSYDINSSSPTPNITNSPVSTTPSPLLALTPISKNIVGEVDDGQTRSQYDSSEELAMIFGMAAPSSAVAPISLPSENASTMTSVASSATTGKKMLALRLTNNATACVAIANNQNCVATTPPATNSTTTFVSSIVIAASTSPTSDMSTSTSPTNTNVDCCYVIDESQRHRQPEHASDNCATFVTIASFRTPETCNLISLVPSAISPVMKSACLDTIPEMHDIHHIGEENDESDVDERFNLDSTNTFDNFNKFVETNGARMMEIFEEDVDERSKISVSSNPDSGNVSLSDFPIHESQQLQSLRELSMNASLELSLLQNSQLTYSKVYPFINRVEIETVGEAVEIPCANTNAGDTSDSDESVLEHTDKGNQLKKNDAGVVDVLSNSTPNLASPMGDDRQCAETELKHRSKHFYTDVAKVQMDSQRASTSCGMSQQPVGDSNFSNSNHSKMLTRVHTRQGFLQHIIIACTFGVTSHDFYTLVAIAFAVIVLVAILLI